MHAVYHCNLDELNEEFIANLKKQFTHAKVDIAIREMDETDYLNSNTANRAHLDAAIAQVNQANLIKKTPTELGL
ncbi:hypothetical protein [Thiomicrospira sp. ALE5]|uniref:hypothetical protein n=1 Tax=Thiomicrospira sp. ALE5 TaxID=748650 RepID=UPI0008F07686|nr:hypothetical protein [Thiomicrospira sp. ALE5]SFR63883.1 antitoxin ParD1/3/4 [Thiomicrospira sp. ALE5]